MPKEIKRAVQAGAHLQYLKSSFHDPLVQLMATSPGIDNQDGRDRMFVLS